MPSIEFYAVQADIAQLLEFVFTETDCLVYEEYSVPGQPLRAFASAEQVLDAYRFDQDAARVPPVQLALWSPATGPEPATRRIELVPGAVDGASHRFVLDGWGLIQLRAGGVRGRRVERSRLAHNTEAWARRWAQTNADRLGPVDDWDWVALTHLGGRLAHHVRRRLAVDKVGTWPVLPGAEACRRAGLGLA